MRTHKTGGLIGLLLLLTGCASTQVTNAWKDPSVAQSPPPSKVLVVALVPSRGTRQQLERALSSRLEAQGISAVPMQTLVPAETEIDRELIKRTVAEQGFDSVLVSRFAGLEEEIHHNPGIVYYDYFAPYGGSPYPYRPSYEVHEKAKMETSLFDAQDGKMKWTATTSTFQPSEVGKKISGLADTLVKKLNSDGVLKSS